jgi:hypothetical protein
MADDLPDDLSEAERQWLKLAGAMAGRSVARCLDLFGEPADDEGFYRRTATLLLEIRADTMPYLLGRPDKRDAYERLAWEVIEKELPAIMASKAVKQ